MSSGTPVGIVPRLHARSCSMNSALSRRRVRPRVLHNSALSACRCPSSSVVVSGPEAPPRRSAIFAISGLSSKSSSRVVAIRSTGAARVSSRNSSRSRSVGSAQCRSSTTTTMGSARESEMKSARRHRTPLRGSGDRLKVRSGRKQSPGDQSVVRQSPLDSSASFGSRADGTASSNPRSGRYVLPRPGGRHPAAQPAALGQLRDQLGDQPRLALTPASPRSKEQELLVWPVRRDAIEPCLERRELLLAPDETGWHRQTTE